MASIEKRKTKKGTTYRITVYMGKHDREGKPVRYRTVYRPEEGITDRQAEKNARAVAEKFEAMILHGMSADSTPSVAEWIEHVLVMKEISGRKKKTISGYRHYAVRICDALGAYLLRDIRVYDIKAFFEKLKKERSYASKRAILKESVDLEAILIESLLSKSELARRAEVSRATVREAARGERIYADNAERIARSLDYDVEDMFLVEKQSADLSARTVEGYYRFLSLLFSAAEREGIIITNPMRHIDPPTFEKQEIEVLQPEELERIFEAAEQETIDKRCMIHLLLITGCRRGELAGLRWSRVLWEDMAIKIDRTIQYTPENGVYEDSTKTRQNRMIRLPKETMDLLQELRKWQLNNNFSSNVDYAKSDNIFRRMDGGIISPDTISGYIRRFRKKYNLSPIYPHLFRHTMASILYYAGSDPVSISKRLGHAQVSTTQNIYSHLIRQADIDSAEHIADAILRGKKMK